jgi:hypothetical protein
VSLTSPAMLPVVADCAHAAAGATKTPHSIMTTLVVLGPFLMNPPLQRQESLAVRDFGSPF